MSYSGAKKRERWTEEEVKALPLGEHDYFDRKSGGLLTNKQVRDFEASLAKHLSAFANSGGGHLVLGVDNDGIIDGVPEKKPGSRTILSEWLEQKIPALLDHPLQSFRVHKVEPSETSTIPVGMILIVIDVGDSPIAPHQDVFSKLYYHRSGGHSVAASHFYLRTLWQRETFPSRRVVRAWFDTVLNPLIDLLQQERDELNKGKWRWDHHRKNLGEGLRFVSYPAYGQSLNLEQFLDSHHEIQELLQEHDRLLHEAREEVSRFFGVVRHSTALAALYQASKQEDVIRQIIATQPHSFAEIATLEQRMQAFFGSADMNAHLAILAEQIVNEVGRFVSGGEKTYGPYWNWCREDFLRILVEDDDVRACRAVADKCRAALLAAVESAIMLVKETRKQLSRDYGEPYVTDDPQLGGYGGLYLPQTFR